MVFDRKAYQKQWYINKKKGLETKTRPQRTKEEWAERRKELKAINDKKYSENKRNLVNAILGDKCYCCGYKERLTCHKKDGEHHKDIYSMNIKNIPNIVNDKEFVRLCYKCHNHVHWCMKILNMDWKEITGRIAK